MAGSALLYVIASVISASAEPRASEGAPSFRPSSAVTAAATVSVRIISGARFGADYVEGHSLAIRRKAQLADSQGQPRDAELLEFQ